MARKWLTRLRLGLWRRDQDDRDLDDELRFHLAEEARLRVDRGASPLDARESARRDFGNAQRVKEVTRAMRTMTSLETIAQDLRYGRRVLSRSPLFAFFAIASLALGIGATTAIFSLFNAIVLRTLPVKDPSRLVALSFVAGGSRQNNFLTYPLFERLREANTTLDGLFAWMTVPRIAARIDARTEIVSAGYVSGDYHRILGLRPVLGRLLDANDDRDSSATSVVIGHDYWRRRFAADPSVVGTQITVGDFSYTIVGVEPRGFVGTNVGSTSDITFPLRASRHGTTGPQPWTATNWTWIEVMARLRAGVSQEQAAQELTSIFRAMGPGVKPLPNAAPPTIFLEPAASGGQSTLRRNYETRLRLMLMLLAAVVLLASLNVATLMLARAEARRDEMTMRLALGAGRWRLVRQLVTESVLVATLGGILGLSFAWWASEALLRLAVRDTAVTAIDLTPDLRVLAFALLTSVGTCVLFGFLPALRSTATLRSTGRHEVGARRRRWLERTLVASQTALSLVLLVFMALFIRSLQNLWARDPGYVRANVAMFSTDARLAGKKGEEIPRTYRTMLDALAALPGVRSVSISTVAPVSTSFYFVNGVGRVGERELRDGERVRAASNFLSPGYFATMGIPLVAGRDFDARDDPDAPKVVIVSERLAGKFIGPAVGQTIDFAGGSEVIGIARDNRYASVKDAPRDVVYAPLFQSAGALANLQTFEVRYDGPSGAQLQAIRTAVAAVDPALTLFNLNTLEGYTRESLSQERLMAATSSYVGAFALLLASIGLYGLMAYAVTERTSEIGLRMALGSSPGGIRSMILRDGAGTVLAGVVVGFGAALWLVRYVQGQIVDLQPMDPASFAVATVVLVIVAAAAAFLPALRASRIDPIVALRHE
ncbi:MAG TPA: ABC transporter permease [Vicinamibacterales bacterium]